MADVYCLGCNERLGWYYWKASDNSQKYKEGESQACVSRCELYIQAVIAGKYLLERERVVKDNAWKLDDAE